MININPYSCLILITGSHELIFSGLKALGRARAFRLEKINLCDPVTRIRHECSFLIVELIHIEIKAFKSYDFLPISYKKFQEQIS
jgi:hypothetical protein